MKLTKDTIIEGKIVSRGTEIQIKLFKEVNYSSDDSIDRKYYKNEFLNLFPIYDNDGLKMKFRSNSGETKWLSINPDSLLEFDMFRTRIEDIDWKL